MTKYDSLRSEITEVVVILVTGTIIGISLSPIFPPAEPHHAEKAYDWQSEPRPVDRTESRDYWQQWCRKIYGTAMEGPGTRQRALDWPDHCTGAGDAK